MRSFFKCRALISRTMSGTCNTHWEMKNVVASSLHVDDERMYSLFQDGFHFKQQEAGENYIMISFIICTLHLIWLPNQGE
jgi:hypothetical protein